MYDFDKHIPRTGTDSLKFDRAAMFGKDDDLLSMWVADMDFAVPPAVIEHLNQRASHGIFGYTNPGPDYFASVCSWMGRYGWSPEPEWIVSTPGVVFALAMAVRAFTKPGEAVLIQRPVYYPFSSVVEQNDRRLVNAPLTYEDHAYSIDFHAFEQAITDNDVKLFLLCNPHNPVGRVWTRNELEHLAEICMKHGVIVVSDEIHMDFIRPGFEHTVFATLGEKFAQSCMVCTAASKTFNLAGLAASNVFIPNAELRERFTAEMLCIGVHNANVMGLAATQACYEEGAEWLEQLKTYLEGNWQLVEDHLAAKAPQLRLIPAGSTYLAWVDCRSLGLFGDDLRVFIEDEAKLWLDLGDMFGSEGDGFIRLNLATQRATVQQALTQLTDALERRLEGAVRAS